MDVKRRMLLGLAATAMATLAMVGSASAGVLAPSAVNCDTPSASKVFSRWLDGANYSLAPGGNAEGSTAGWTFSGGARVGSGNEPWKVGGGGAKSFSIPAGGSLTSAPVCVGLDNPTIRFFAHRTGGLLLSTLAVSVRFQTVAGLTLTVPIGVVPGLSTSWSPSLPMTVIANLLPLLPNDKTAVQFRFTPVLGGSWQVDDLYVDPWRMR
jgi:hypothetical protein